MSCELARKRRSLALFLFATTVMSAPHAHSAPTSQVFQLTSGPSADLVPAVSGTTYVWRRGLGGIGEIYRWTEGDPTPTLISSTTKETLPRISANRVVWQSDANGDAEVILWDAGVLSSVTSNSDTDATPDIDGTGIVWRFNNTNLIYDDGVSQIPITAATGHADERPVIGDNLIVWESSINGGQSGREVFYWQAGIVNRLTANAFEDRLPVTDGTTIVWVASDGPSGETAINRVLPGGQVVRITEYVMMATQPDVSGDVVTFIGWDGLDWEIYFRYFGIIYQVTDNDYDDFEPAIDGDRIVWEGRDNGGRHIFYAVLSGLDGGVVPGACCVGLACTIETATDCATIGGTSIGKETFCEIDTCPEAVQPAAGWSTFQHDMQRTGRTDAIIPTPPTRIWGLFTGAVGGMQISPSIGPDGTIYAMGVNTRLLAVNPDGGLKWSARLFGASASAPPTIRADGYFFLQTQSSVSKRNPSDGEDILCTNPIGAALAPAVDDGGAVYVRSVRKLSADCQAVWAYPELSNVHSHISLSQDGDPIVARTGEVVRIDRLTGLEVWNYLTTTAAAGAPAISADGTIYVYDSPNTLVALNPDGSLQWALPLPGIQLSQPASAPAIGGDGSVYISTKTTTSNPTLISVSSVGVERWRFTESISTGAHGLSLVIDGSGTVIFSVEFGDVIGISSASGSELWRIDLGDDSPLRSPAIGEDGTLYVTTEAGYLIAFGEGCPEPDPVTPPFTYRAVARKGETINGFSLGDFQDFALLDDGRATFRAFVSATSTHGVFTELPGGGFETFVRGSIVDGFEIDDVSIPAYDDAGNKYLAANLSGIGGGVFVNDQMAVRENVPIPPVAPVLIDDMSDSFFGIDLVGNFLVYGRPSSNAELGVLRIRVDSQNIDPSMLLGQVVGAIMVEQIDLSPQDERHVDINTRTYVLHGQGQSVVTSDLNIRATVGDTIDGKLLTGLAQPQVDGAEPVFLGAFSGGNGLFTLGSMLVGTGDTVDGLTIAQVISHSHTNGVSAFVATLDDARLAVFRGNALIAVEGTTMVDGALVQTINPASIRKNEGDDVAFVATVAGSTEAVFVASGPDGAFSFRRAVTDGDTINTTIIGSIQDLRLDDGGLISFRAGNTPTTTTIHRETSIGLFDSWSDGDQVAGLTVDFSLSSPFAPRVNPAGTEFICVPIAGIGPVVFVDRIPLCQKTPQPDDQHIIFDTIDWEYLDANENGAFTVRGKQLETDQDAVYEITTPGGVVSTLLARNDVIDGFEVDEFSVENHASFNDSRTIAIETSDAVLTQEFIIALRNDDIDGHIIINPKAPRLLADNTVYFMADGHVFRRTPTGLRERVIGIDDVIAGQPIVEVLAHDANDAFDLAAWLTLIGTDGIFLNGWPVAIQSVTQINGLDVLDVGPTFRRVRLNNAGQVAFVARVQGSDDTLYVATLDLSFDADNDSDVDEDDLAAFTECVVDGSGVLTACDCTATFDATGDAEVSCADWPWFVRAWTQPASPELPLCDSTIPPSAAAGDDLCIGGSNDSGSCSTDVDCPAGVCGNKSRYVTITPSVAVSRGGGRDLSIRIAIVSLPLDPARVGEIWWAGPSDMITNSPNPALNGAQVLCEATPANAEVWPAGNLHLSGGPIVPGASYEVRMCDPTGANCSDPLLVATGKWGDVKAIFGGGGQPDFVDISAIVDKFGNLASAPDTSRTDLRGAGNPGDPNAADGIIDFTDISIDVDAFSNVPYPFTVPACP